MREPSQTIQVRIKASNLAIIDAGAKRAGMTRSAFVVAGALAFVDLRPTKVSNQATHILEVRDSLPPTVRSFVQPASSLPTTGNLGAEDRGKACRECGSLRGLHQAWCKSA
jgi:hypothetical protein